MKRVSKYERMVGTEINSVLVSNYRRIEKVSKTSGRKYYRYEVELNNVIWVSTTSFNKGSYGKRLAKAMASEAQPKEEVDTEFRQRFDTEIDFLMEQAYRIKESIKERAERWMDINFENVSFCGAILFDSPEKRIAFVNSIMDDNSNDIFGIIHANEWRTEHKAKFEARIYNSWDRIWKRTQKEWEAFQEKRNGATGKKVGNVKIVDKPLTDVMI